MCNVDLRRVASPGPLEAGLRAPPLPDSLAEQVCLARSAVSGSVANGVSSDLDGEAFSQSVPRIDFHLLRRFRPSSHIEVTAQPGRPLTTDC